MVIIRIQMYILEKILLYPISKANRLFFPIWNQFNGCNVLMGEEVSLLINNAISDSKPIMISRFGSEIHVLNVYIQICNKILSKYKTYIQSGIEDKYTNHIRHVISNNNGVFPTNDETLNCFSEITLNSVKNIDVLGIWKFLPREKQLYKQYCPHSQLIEAKYIEPYYHISPWTKLLEGKKILVIHPFTESIKNQFTKRKLLYEDPNMLPDFDLKTIKAVQSLAGNPVDFKDWMEALDYMKSEIDKVDFDIALIGAGAYGLPLASYVKTIGKKAIHLGGAIQILFGIKGQRWDNHPIISKLYNKHWTRPLPSETIKKYKHIEDGCYW